jgi:hypothetical protein
MDDFINANPSDGSTLCGIKNSASGNCMGKPRTSYVIADSILAAATTSLQKINSLGTTTVPDLALYQKNIAAHGYLSLYYGEKIKGATFSSAKNSASARTAMGNAYCHWIKYTTLMDELHSGAAMERTKSFSNWQVHNSPVLAEYTALGGSGMPVCPVSAIDVSNWAHKPILEIISITENAVFCKLLGHRPYRVDISTTNGRHLAEIRGQSKAAGVHKIPLGVNLSRGLFVITLRSEGQSIMRPIYTLGH